LRVSDIAALLTELAEKNPKDSPEMEVPDIEVQPDILELPMQEKRKKITAGKPTEVTCPECGGVIWEQKEEGLIHYRCHVGHAYSADVMKDAKNQNVEAAIWNTIRILEEKDSLLRRMAAVVEQLETSSSKEELLEEAEKARRYANQIRSLLYEEEEKRSKKEFSSPQIEEGLKS
jgi:two-component system chemotaxis response regulator CheB